MNRELLYIWIPSMIANGIPPIASKIFPHFLSQPLDFGKSIHGVRILGNHKTVRGMLFGILFGQLTFILIYPYVNFNLPWYFGILSASGSLFGDLLKSFFKRRAGISSGASWIPFDQIDWILGFLVVILFFVRLSIYTVIIYISLGFILHMASNVVGKLLKINEKYI